MNFVSDLAIHYKKQLEEAGYKTDLSEKKEEDVISIFLNTVRRQIVTKPRNLHISKEITCPAIHQCGYDFFCNRVEKGLPLYLHQSKNIFEPGYNDPLFNDWYIHHFHLGTELEDNGMFKRTTAILFAIVLDGDFYCLSILDHHKSFSKKELVNIAYRNWPELFESTKLNGILPSEFPKTDEDIYALRKANVGSCITMEDGSVHAGLGWGSMSNGLSMQVLRETIRIKRNCIWLQDWVKANIKYLILESGR